MEKELIPFFLNRNEIFMRFTAWDFLFEDLGWAGWRISRRIQFSIKVFSGSGGGEHQEASVALTTPAKSTEAPSSFHCNRVVDDAFLYPAGNILSNPAWSEGRVPAAAIRLSQLLRGGGGNGVWGWGFLMILQPRLYFPTSHPAIRWIRGSRIMCLHAWASPISFIWGSLFLRTRVRFI